MLLCYFCGMIRKRKGYGMKNLSEWTIKRLQGVGAVFVTFPAVVVFALFAAIALIMKVGASGQMPLLDSLFLTFVVGAVSNLLLMLLVRKREHSGGWPLALTGIGIIIPCGIFLLLYGMEDASGLWKMRVLALIGVMLVGIVMILCRRCRCGMAIAAWLLLRRLLVGLVFGGVFFLSGGAVVFLVSVVAGTNGSADVMMQMLITSAFICLLFVLRAFVEPENQDWQTESMGYRHTMEKVISYIFIPLVLCYFVVELLLIVRAVIYDHWPDAPDTFLRIAILLGLGVLTYLLCHRFENFLCRFYRVFFPCAGLLVLGVGVWRLVLLILQYGMSETRYGVLLGSVVFAVLLLMMLVDMRDKSRIAALVISASLVISVLPYVNYHTVSAYSQMTRAQDILNHYGMLTDSGIKPPQNMKESDRLELSRAVQYLYDEKETAMAKWLPIHFDFHKDFSSVFGVAGEFDTVGQSTIVTTTYMGLLDEKYYPTEGYDLILTNYTTYNLFNFTAQEIVGKKGTYTVRFSQVAGESLVAVVTRDGETIAEVDVTDQLTGTAKYLAEHISDENESVAMPLEQMTVQFETDAVRVRVVLKSVSVTADRISRGLSTALTDIILIDEK